MNFIDCNGVQQENHYYPTREADATTCPYERLVYDERKDEYVWADRTTC